MTTLMGILTYPIFGGILILGLTALLSWSIQSLRKRSPYDPRIVGICFLGVLVSYFIARNSVLGAHN